jgi:adenylate cyclase
MSDPLAVSRRLVAVFAADVEGYSRLMGADEVGTLKGLTERRAILDGIIGEYKGRIANTAGICLPLWQHSGHRGNYSHLA